MNYIKKTRKKRRNELLFQIRWNLLILIIITIDEIAKGTIHKEVIFVDLPLDVIESPNVSNETLQYFADLIRPEKQGEHLWVQYVAC